MKRLLSLGLSILCIFFAKTVSAQAIYSVSAQQMCYNTSGTYTLDAGLFVGSPGANNYTWAAISQNTACVASFSFGQHGALNPANTGSQVAVSFPCCGVYTVVMQPMFGSLPAGGPTASVITIFCPNSGSITATPSVICVQSSSQLNATGTGTGAVTYTWSTGANTNPITVSPTVNTCYSFTATTAQGCTVSPAAACVSVQAVSMTVNPSSQTICASAPLCFTVNSQVITLNATPNTATTGLSVFDPNGNPVSTCTTPAVAGNFSFALTHTGQAGTCTYTQLANVVTSNSISVTASANVPSVCPGASVQLTAVSIATSATNYTWTGPGTATIAGNPVVRNPTAFTVFNVTADYYGCLGSAQVAVGMLSLSPTASLLANPSGSVCPNRSLTVVGGGGTTFTFTAYPAVTPPPFIVLPKPTSNTGTWTPTAAQLPAAIVVQSFSNGCTGSTTLIVRRLSLTPTLSLKGNPTNSVCPATEFTLTSTGGAGTNYTFTAPYPSANTPIPKGSVTSNTAAHSPGGNTAFPYTYNVFVDSAGCVGSAALPVNILTLRTQLGITAPTGSICPGGAATFTVRGGQTTTFSLVGPAPGPSTVVIANYTNTVANSSITPYTHTTVTNPALPHIYTVYADSAGCVGTASVQIGTLNLSPFLVVTGLKPAGITGPHPHQSFSLCPNTNIAFSASVTNGTANNYTYTFMAPGTNVLPKTGVNISNYTPASLPQTLTVIADSMGCVGQTTVALRALVLNPSIAATPSLICKTKTATLTVSGVNNSNTGNVNYVFGVWGSPPTPLPGMPTTQKSATVAPLVNTVYFVGVDSLGCNHNPLQTPTVQVSIRPDLVLLPTTSAASVCPGTAATLAANAPTNSASPNFTWTWSQIAGTGTLTPTGSVSASTASALAYPTTPSTYSLHALDSLGCVGSATIDIGIDPTIGFPVALSSSGSTVCAGQTVSLSANYTVNTQGNITYTWSPTGAIQGSNTGSMIVAAPQSATIYTAVLSNPYGCVSGNTIEVPFGTYPNVTPLRSHPAVCVGFTSTLTAFGAFSYTWTGSTFTGGIAQQSIAAGPGSYTVLGSNGGSCTQLKTITVGTLAPLTISISASSKTTCIANNFPKWSHPVGLQATGASEYIWQPYDPAIMTVSLGPQTTVRPPATMVFTVTGSTDVCATQRTHTVNVITQFTMEVVPPRPALCFGDSLKLTIVNIGTLAVGPSSKFSYSWTPPAPFTMTNPFQPEVTVFPQTTSVYSVEMTDSRGCKSEAAQITVTVLPQPLTAVAIPTINGAPTNSLCYVGNSPGEPFVTLNLIAKNENTGLNFGVVPTYTWLNPYNPPYQSILTNPNAGGITISAPLRAPQVITYTVISGYNGVKGCKVIDTVSVRIVDCRPVTSVSMAVVDDMDTICVRQCITFKNITDTAAGGPQQLEWEFENGFPATSTEQFPTVCYNVPGAWNVKLKVSNQYPTNKGSSGEYGWSDYIRVVDVPNVMIVPPAQRRSDTIVRFGSTINLKASGALTYSWEPDHMIKPTLTSTNVSVSPVRSTQYILTGYNSKGCSSSDTINVIIVDDCGEMYVPNAFTPNGDGVNDVLYVRGICLQNLTFMIFNRWGEKVFETSDQKLGWDGTYKGELMNTGVFVYRLEGRTYEGKGFSSKGNVTLIR